jgi:hypothetical protein
MSSDTDEIETLLGRARGGDCGALAELFERHRHRRGERPAPSEYTARHPELAEQIRELFSGLLVMEAVRPGAPDAAGAGAVRGGAGPPLAAAPGGVPHLPRRAGRRADGGH